MKNDKCRSCKGRGRVAEQCSVCDPRRTKLKCLKCLGVGTVLADCWPCGGTGRAR